MKEDAELREFRELMLPPDVFEEGFNMKTVIGSIFVGLIMMPASMFLGLITGQGIGGAAQWVTVILFLEVARQTLTTMRRPEIFVLWYMCGAAIAAPFSGLLWNQYFATSPDAHSSGIAALIPNWYAPGEDVINLRTFFHRAWLPAIGYITLVGAIGRIDRFGLSYVLYRITSDVEKLPFPLAPVGAMGVTALAESSAGKETWRWRVFSIGTMLGMAFTVVYVAIPQISNVIWGQRIDILPIPFVDFTTNTQNILPAVPMNLSLDLANLIIGMVLPFWAIIGTFAGWVATVIANPILYKVGVLTSWQPGMDAIKTSYQDWMDFYLSFGIGLAVAIALIGIYYLFRTFGRRPSETMQIEPEGSLWQRLMRRSKARGDVPIWVGILIYLFSTTSYILICRWLVPEFPTWILVAYGFVYMPFIAYASVRLEATAGQFLDIPMVREAAFILSGYRGVKIWFAPIPAAGQYGPMAVGFRTIELTGTKLTSIIKAELIIFPVIMVASILYSQLIWRIAAVPSAAYPFAEKMWPLNAMYTCTMWSATTGEYTPFFDAVKWWVIGSGVVIGLSMYSFLAYLGLPVMFLYGVVRGMGQIMPHVVVPQLIGALLGRYYFRKRFGTKWRQYVVVLFAGFGCGTGLMTMLVVGLLFISKAVFQLPY